MRQMDVDKLINMLSPIDFVCDLSIQRRFFILKLKIFKYEYLVLYILINKKGTL